jgi:poly-gamma-glutamate synthesis protein (capsule biosynthesis protein)
MQILRIACLLICIFIYPRAGFAQDQIVRVSFVGDVMVAMLPGELITKGRDPFTAFADIFKSSDINIGNLETSVASGGKPMNKPYAFRATPAAVSVLKKVFSRHVTGQ